MRGAQRGAAIWAAAGRKAADGRAVSHGSGGLEVVRDATAHRAGLRAGAILIAAVGFALLAGCGVDGPPRRPAPAASEPAPGASVSGDVYVGLRADVG